jgi:hypothetical protein
MRGPGGRTRHGPDIQGQYQVVVRVVPGPLYSPRSSSDAQFGRSDSPSSSQAVGVGLSRRASETPAGSFPPFRLGGGIA